MPELPEVETVRLGLARLLPGRQIAKVDFDWPKSFPNAEANVREFVINASITAVKRRAKVLSIELSTNYSLVIHLKMTGQLVFRGSNEKFGAGHPSQSLVGNLPDRSTRVTLTFSDGSQLFFNDQRKFGWMKLVPTPEVMDLDFFQKVGPEPLSDDFTWQIMRDRLMKRSNTNVKAALLDQTVLAGVGNIYADESLWGAKIHPATLVKQLLAVQFHNLYDELVFALKLAIEKGGSTDKNYVNAEGKRGNYLNFARVFRREGQACPRCGTIIEKTRVAGRGTHLCPTCQRIKSA
jgi:formamidopyrimidine-DNA glycosylase